MERIRKVDLDSMPQEQFEQVEKALGKKVQEIIGKTVTDLNTYLNVYGLEILLGVQVVKQGEANLIKETINQAQKASGNSNI